MCSTVVGWVDDAVDNHLADRPAGDGAQLPVGEPFGDVDEAVRCLARLVDVPYLLDQRPSASDAVRAVAAREVAAYVVDAHLGGADEQERAGIGEPSVPGGHAEPAQQVWIAGSGEIESGLVAGGLEVAAGDRSRDRARLLQGVPGGLRGPVDAGPGELAGMPACRIHLDAVVVKAPLELSLEPDWLDRRPGWCQSGCRRLPHRG